MSLSIIQQIQNMGDDIVNTIATLPEDLPSDQLLMFKQAMLEAHAIVMDANDQIDY